MPRLPVANCRSKPASDMRRGNLRLAFCVAVCLLATTSIALAQDMVMPGASPMGMEDYAAPVTEFGQADFFSQDLGTMLRLRYNTESYGQSQHGNFDIGTMQVLSLDNSIFFVDGQVTLNDKQGVGFNIGTGYRWMTYPPFAADMGRVLGASIWADGNNTDAGNFYPQIGLSLESLGDLWDFRFNGYLPLGDQDTVGEFVPTGDIGFQGNSIAQLTQAVLTSSYAAAELEAARRLGPERDAWVFAGPYVVGNDDNDSAGIRAGVRGYAYPDLMLQLAVSNDEIFDTNASFTAIWFVGRTRTDYRPACNSADRMREPVLRNDYVVFSERLTTGGIPLTNPDGTELRIVHVNGNTTTPGIGTFENPLAEQQFDEINNFSQQGDIILAWAESQFQAEGAATLLNNQQLFGEGDGFEHSVVTNQGTLILPETSPGARNAARPLILQAIGDAVVLANNVEVGNFDFRDITGNAISGLNMTGGALLHDLDVVGGGDFAIALVGSTSTSSVILDEFTYDGEADAAGGILFDNFDGSFSATDSSLTNGTRAGVRVTNGSDGNFNFASTFTLESIDNTTGAAFEIDGFTGSLTMNGTIENIDEAGSDVGRAVSIQNMSLAGTTVTFGATADIMHTSTGANEEGVFISGNSNGTVTFNGDLILRTNGSIAFNVNEAGNDVTLTAASANNLIDARNAIGLQIIGAQIGGTGVTFPVFDAQGGANGIVLNGNTSLSNGAVVIGTLGNDPGETGEITNTTGDAVLITNSANVVIHGLEISNLANNAGVVIRKTNTSPMIVNLNDLRIHNGDFGIDVDANNTTGDLDLTVADTEILRSTNIGMRFNEVDDGDIVVNNTTINGQNVAAGARGVLIENSDTTNATFTFDSGTEIRQFAGTDFEVSGGSAVISYAGDIRNSNLAPTPGDTTGRSVHIHNITGGSVTFTTSSSIVDDNQGTLVDSNTGGTVSFQGTNTFDTGALDALTVTNNTGGTYSFNNFDIETTSGRGVNMEANSAAATISFNDIDVVSTSGIAFRAIGPGTLNVQGATNTLGTTTGIGLVIDGMTIGTNSIAFQSVNVTNGVSNAIFLQNLAAASATAQVAIGSSGGAPDSGGTITTTGTAVIVRNVANADLRNIRVASAGDDGFLIEHTSTSTFAMDVTLDGLNIDATTNTGLQVTADNDSHEFRMRLRDGDLEENVTFDARGNATVFLLVEDTDINVDGGANAFDLAFSDTARNGEITFRDNNNFNAVNGRALAFTTSGSDNKIIDLLIEDSDFVTVNNGVGAATFTIGNVTTLNATIEGNVFNNPGGNDFDMRTTSASANAVLKLGDASAADKNTAGVGGTGDFLLSEIAGDFVVFELNETTVLQTRNNGTVTPVGTLGNTNVEPPLPTLP